MPQETGGIPRYRGTTLPALFSQGFRPFFLGAGLWAPTAMLLWILQLSGLFVLPTAFGPAAWHAHEMIFGFAQAAMAGFLMTAIPNWTGRMPLQGAGLLTLVASWVIGRVAMATSIYIGVIPAAVLDLLFPVLLLATLGREVLVGRNWRNLPAMAALTLMIGANVSTHLAAAGLAADTTLGGRAGIAILSTMISLVGGKLIPSFTRNRLVRMGSTFRPASFGSLDRVALGMVPTALAAWAVEMTQLVTGPLLIVASVLTAARLARWHGWRILGDVSLWPLHAGYGWLALGLALLGVSALYPHVSSMAGLHALTIGAIGTSILAVMGRATFAQTGRRTDQLPRNWMIHGLIAISAVSRVSAEIISEPYRTLVWIAGLAWILAFAVFLTGYGAVLVAPKHQLRQSNGDPKTSQGHNRTGALGRR